MESIPNNLPLQLSSFVGREREIADVKRLLLKARLVTLTGTGGSGKTRLALQVAADVVGAFAGGVWFVDLAPLSDPSLVPQRVASTLDVREQPGQPLLTTLTNYLRDKQLLLMLDNCEHLIEACAQLAEALLQSCAHLRILATSREALRITGETIFLMPSLASPDPSQLPLLEALTQFEAIRLFAERASAAQPTFAVTQRNATVVAQICYRLDGIPLAIELAAVRVRALSAKQIAARLDDVFYLLTSGSRTALARHQTLRAAIDWSYELLPEQERTLFRRLSVFAGGWTLEAAESVCSMQKAESSAGSLPADVLGLLTQLVNKSLVLAEEQGGEARYRMLETIRQYAREKLIEAGEEAPVRDCHLQFFMGFAEQAELKLQDAEYIVWFNALKIEQDNLRAGMDWSLENESTVERGLRLVSALWWFYWIHAHVGGGRERLLALLAQPLAMRRTPMRAKALNTAAGMRWNEGYYPEVYPLCEESLAISRELGDSRNTAWSFHILALADMSRGDYATAQARLEAALALRRELGDKWHMSFVLDSLGDAYLALGDYERARACSEKSIALIQEHGDKNIAAYAMRQLGRALMREGNFLRAADMFQESLAINLDIEDRRSSAACLAGLAEVAMACGQVIRAVQLYGTVESFVSAIGMPLVETDRQAYDHNVATLRTQLDEATFAKAWLEGRQMTMDGAIAEVERITAEASSTVSTALLIRSEDSQNLEVPSSLSGAVDKQPSRELGIYALGTARVFRGTQLLTDDDWKYSKSKELLFYLLSHDYVTKEQVGLAFWPDISAAQLRSLFSVVMHHLRRALGPSDWVLFKDGHYVFNRARAYWFDVEAFESTVAQAQTLLQVPSPERREAILKLQGAVKLYRGDFLQDVGAGDWHLLRREELRRQHLEALLTLGQLLVGAQEYGEAAQVYLRAISGDSYLEVAHRELMRCYARQGERGQALRQYRTLLELMRDELDAQPAPETTALFERIRRGKDV